MIIQKLKLPGVRLITLEKHSDERGFFARSFCEDTFKASGLEYKFPQENISFNKKRGTLRGLHYQTGLYSETKLVECTRGKIYDVVVDIRENSLNHGEWLGIELSENNKQILYVPEGFAHGFITLEDETEVHYHMSVRYHPESAKTIHWNDPSINIIWPQKPVVISDLDQNAKMAPWN